MSERNELNRDRVLMAITGPDALVGPALIYQGDIIAIMIAHGNVGTEGRLLELQLGTLAGEVPDEFSRACDTVITIRRGDEITMDEAQNARAGIIAALRKNLASVAAFDTDLDLARAYADKFPSEQSRRVLRDILADEAPIG